MNVSKAQVMNPPRLHLGGKDKVQENRESSFQLFNLPLYDTSKKIECCLICCNGFDVNPALEVFKNTSSNLKLKTTIKVKELQNK